MLDRLRMRYGVLIQPSVYGTDNPHRLCRGKAVESYKVDMMRIAYITAARFF